MQDISNIRFNKIHTKQKFFKTIIAHNKHITLGAYPCYIITASNAKAIAVGWAKILDAVNSNSVSSDWKSS